MLENINVLDFILTGHVLTNMVRRMGNENCFRGFFKFTLNLTLISHPIYMVSGTRDNPPPELPGASLPFLVPKG